MGAFEEFQRMVSSALSALDDGFELIEQARLKADDAQAQYADMAGQSNSDKLHDAANKAQDVVRTIDEATVFGRMGLDEFNAYLNEIGAQGSSGAKGTVGDQVTAPKLKAAFDEKEHSSSDDGDKSLSRFDRLSRGAIRNTGDTQKQATAWVKANKSVRVDYDPRPTATYTCTVHTPEMSTPGHANMPDPTDIVGNAVVIAAMTLEAVSRSVRRRMRSKDG